MTALRQYGTICLDAEGETLRAALMASSEFKRRFIERTKRIREDSGKTQQQMADILRIQLPRYQKYETRSWLPHDRILAFCQATGFTPNFLYTGRPSTASEFTIANKDGAGACVGLDEKAETVHEEQDEFHPEKPD